MTNEDMIYSLLKEVREVTGETRDAVIRQEGEIDALKEKADAHGTQLEDLHKRMAKQELWRTGVGWIGVAVGAVLSFMGLDFVRDAITWFMHHRTGKQ